MNFRAAFFLFSAEMLLGAKPSFAKWTDKNLRRLQGPTCEDFSTTHTAGAPPSTTPLKAAEIVTWAYPMTMVGDTAEIGETEGYCVGLGTAADEAGGAICTFIYVFETNEVIQGTITASDVEDPEEKSAVRAITGGTGKYEGAYGQITATPSTNGTWVHEFHVCV